MRTPRLYDQLAHLWPVLSPPTDYAPEAQSLRAILRAHVQPRNRRPTLLELGVGGGHTLHHLLDAFDAVAVDVSDAMLANCRRLNPSVETVVGDMRTVRLGRVFDAVLIHDAIDYMTSRDDVVGALQTAGAHLKPDGLLLVAPTYVRETFDDGAVEMDCNKAGDLSLTYLSWVHDADPDDSEFELTLLYLIQQGRTLRIESDRHRCGLFSEAEWLDMLDTAGFDAALHEDDVGWSLFVGIRRP